MSDVVIIGAGLFGQIIAKALIAQGRYVTIIDAEYKQAGSRPAACLMKPSWFSGLGRQVYTPALETLDELYGVRDVEFIAGKIAKATVHWIPPTFILHKIPLVNYIKGEVVRVTEDRQVIYQDVEHLNVERITARLIVCAGGVWTERLFPQYRQVAQKGVAFLQPGAHISTPTIAPWAPYRQLVAFNRGDGLWVSDGTAIKKENWTPQRELTAYDRCNKYFTAPHDVRALLGLRPYAKGHKPCLLEQPAPGIWVASGGAKNGTLAAGWCAHEIRRLTS